MGVDPTVSQREIGFATAFSVITNLRIELFKALCLAAGSHLEREEERVVEGRGALFLFILLCGCGGEQIAVCVLYS